MGGLGGGGIGGTGGLGRNKMAETTSKPSTITTAATMAPIRFPFVPADFPFARRFGLPGSAAVSSKSHTAAGVAVAGGATATVGAAVATAPVPRREGRDEVVAGTTGAIFVPDLFSPAPDGGPPPSFDRRVGGAGVEAAFASGVSSSSSGVASRPPRNALIRWSTRGFIAASSVLVRSKNRCDLSGSRRSGSLNSRLSPLSYLSHNSLPRAFRACSAVAISSSGKRSTSML